MQIMVATDPWKPQVNGVVRSLESVARALREFDAELEFLTPQGFATVPLPTYGEIRIGARELPGAVTKRLDSIRVRPYSYRDRRPDRPCRAPLLLAREAALSRRAIIRGFRNISRPEPKYRNPSLTRLLRRFHNAGCGVMVSTASIADDLNKHGFQRLMHWSRGVDHRQFAPAKAAACDLPRPIFLYAGRVAPEKNVEAFLKLDLPGSKVVVGDGPSRRALQAALSGRPFPRHQNGRSLGSAICLRRCLRVPEPHRYLRHGPYRSTRQWSSRWRPCRCRDRSTSSARAAPVCSIWICAPPVFAALDIPREKAQSACAHLHLGEQRAPIPRQYLGGQNGRSKLLFRKPWPLRLSLGERPLLLRDGAER